MDRIQIEYVNVSELTPAEYNPRLIDAENLAKLTESVQRYGVVDPIIARRDGLVIGGHQRLKAAHELGLTEVPVVYLDMDDATSKALNVALNNPALQGIWDDIKLADVLTELRDFNILEWTGFDDNYYQSLQLALAEPVFEPVGIADQSRLDERSKIQCPECGHEFIP